MPVTKDRVPFVSVTRLVEEARAGVIGKEVRMIRTAGFVSNIRRGNGWPDMIEFTLLDDKGSEGAVRCGITSENVSRSGGWPTEGSKILAVGEAGAVPSGDERAAYMIVIAFAGQG